MNKMKSLLALLALLISASSVFAQIENDFEEQMRKEFEAFEQKSKKSFDDFVKANDEAFSKHLRSGWVNMEVTGKEAPPKDPKPVDRPVITPSVEKVQPTAIAFSAPEADEPANQNYEPIKQKAEPASFPTNMLAIPFFGTSTETAYDKSFPTSVAKPITNNVIADYWDVMAQTNHYSFINQLQAKKEEMQLNDWGYYELVKKAAEDICQGDRDAATLMTWFVLVKSQYRAKVGFSPDGAHLMLPFSNKVYGKPYFVIDGMRYYVLERVDRLSTYKQDYKVATNKIVLDVEKPLKIGNEIKTRDLEFEYKGKKYNFTVEYVQNDIKFYESYPQADVKVYFDAAVSDIAKQSLVSQLKPIVSTMGQVEASDFLLGFVQKAFPYKTDPEQFGREKFFFAEEIFYYPYSDCEDRSVLYSFLVRELLGLEVIGLKYPGHMATAVAFTEDIDQHHMFYAGKKFTVCDPTYINATTGMCMPQFINANAFIVPMK